MAESRKIGEGRVDLTANAQPLEAGLESAKRSTENWAQSVTGAARNVGAAIATAYAAFRVGNQIGEAIKSMRELNIITQDYRRAVGAAGADAFSETQAAKMAQRLDMLKRQFGEIGDAAGASARITQQEFEAAIRNIAEKQRQRVEQTTKEAFESALPDAVMEGETGSVLRQFGYRSETEALKQAESAIRAVNQAYEDQKRILEDIKNIQDAQYANQAQAAILARQEAQRAGFSLADQVLAESVVNRELGRIYDITPPAQGRY